MEKNTYVDPLDNVMEKFRTGKATPPTPMDYSVNPEQEIAVNVKVNEPADTITEPIEISSDVNVTSIPIVDESTNVESTETEEVDDIDYGEDDIEKDMADEDAAREEAMRVKMLERMEAEKANEKSPIIISTDKNYQNEAIGWQTETIAIVTEMVNKVVANNNLSPGGIALEKRRMIMGELVAMYQLNGEDITPEFEKLIVDNWEADSSVNNTSDSAASSKTEEDKPDVPTINIQVEKNNPVTINVDDSIMAKTTSANVLNIVVTEVSEKEMLSGTIVENSNREDVITPYDPGIRDMPITLPLSGYRCVMRPVNWFDTICMNAPSSNNLSDIELQKWTVYYDHMKNLSIGNFKDFREFLQGTKYQDKELIAWALLVATSDDIETIEIKCLNPNCDKSIKVEYAPRSIVKLDEERIPSYYLKTHDVAVGKEANEHFKYVSNMRKIYTLPDTKIMVEINEPSADEYINTKLPLLETLFHRYKPNSRISSEDINLHNQDMYEFDYLASHAMFISAMRIKKGDKTFRYTKWDDIEHIIRESLSMTDSGVLLRIIQMARTSISSVSFVLPHVECPYCHHSADDVIIGDIGGALLFPQSNRLAATEINLIDQPQNS